MSYIFEKLIMKDETERHIRVAFLGDKSSGKTQLINLIKQLPYQDNYQATKWSEGQSDITYNNDKYQFTILETADVEINGNSLEARNLRSSLNASSAIPKSFLSSLRSIDFSPYVRRVSPREKLK